MPARASTTIVPHLWYMAEAEAAARFYAKIFPKSRVDRVWKMRSESGAATSVVCVQFRLLGQPFFAMTAGQGDNFNNSISFGVPCRTQAEIDRYWKALLKNGGREVACGWLVDRFGVRWQIYPTVLLEMMADRNKKKAGRVATEMQQQVKFDIAKLEAAFH